MLYKKLPALAFLMIVFLLALSCFASAVIYNVTVTGRDNAPGAVRPSDNVAVSSLSIMPCFADMSGNGSFVQMNCQEISTPLACALTKTVNNLSGMISYRVRESGSGDELTGYAYVDIMAPVITSIATASIGNAAKVVYKLKDSANSYYPDKCSGIEKVELYLNGKVVNTTSHSAGVCTVDSSITGTLPDTYGLVNVSIKVYDYMDYVANAVGVPVSIDTKAPKIGSKADIFIAGGENKLTKIPPNITASVDIEVSVQDNAVFVSGIKADFSELNSANGNISAASCTLAGNNSYTCRFNGVSLKSGKASPKIIVYARDESGNSASQTITLSYTIATPKLSAKIESFRAGTGEKLSKVPPANSTKSVKTDLVVTATYDGIFPLTTLSADLRELTSNAGMSNVAGSCSNDENQSYTCRFLNVDVKPKTSTPKINLTAADGFGSIAKQQVSLSYIIVSNAGTVASLGINGKNCISTQCFVSSTAKATATINAQVGFNDSDVYFNSQKAECYANNTVWTCSAAMGFQENQMLLLTGHDVFGNYISAKANVTVDPNPPVILSFNVTAPSGKDLESISKGDSILVTAIVSDNYFANASADITSVSVLADEATEKIVAGTCKGKTQMNCTWTIKVEQEGYLEALTLFRFYDKAGNSALQNVIIVIKEVANSTPDLWNLTAKYNPKIMNSRLLQYYPKTIYSHLSLHSKEPTAKITEISVIACAAKEVNNSGAIARYADPLLPSTLSISADKKSLVTSAAIESKAYNTTELVWSCLVKLKTVTKTTIYTKPELELYNITIKLQDSPLLSDNVNSEIEEKREELNGSYTKTIVFLDKWINRINTVCSMLGVIGKVTTAFNSVQVIAPIPPLQNAARKGKDLSEKFGGSVYGKIAKHVCEFTQCSADYNKVLFNSKYFPGASYLGDKLAYPAAAAGLDPQGALTHGTPEQKQQATTSLIVGSTSPYDSFVSASLTLCAPGMLYNMKKLQVMKCEYLSCLENDVPNGMPITECQRTYSYNKCVFWAGNLASAPWISMTTYISNNIKALVSDPLAMGGMIASMVACKAIPEVQANGMCTLPLALDKLNAATRLTAIAKDAYNMGKKLKNMKTGEERQPDDICKEILDSKSALVSLPYNIRTGELTSCTNTGYCPGTTSGTAITPSGDVSIVQPFSDATGNLATQLTPLRASFEKVNQNQASLLKAIDELEVLIPERSAVQPQPGAQTTTVVAGSPSAPAQATANENSQTISNLGTQIQNPKDNLENKVSKLQSLTPTTYVTQEAAHNAALIQLDIRAIASLAASISSAKTIDIALVRRYMDNDNYHCANYNICVQDLRVLQTRKEAELEGFANNNNIPLLQQTGSQADDAFFTSTDARTNAMLELERRKIILDRLSENGPCGRIGIQNEGCVEAVKMVIKTDKSAVLIFKDDDWNKLLADARTKANENVQQTQNRVDDLYNPQGTPRSVVNLDYNIGLKRQLYGSSTENALEAAKKILGDKEYRELIKNKASDQDKLNAVKSEANYKINNRIAYDRTTIASSSKEALDEQKKDLENEVKEIKTELEQKQKELNELEKNKNAPPAGTATAGALGSQDVNPSTDQNNDHIIREKAAEVARLANELKALKDQIDAFKRISIDQYNNYLAKVNRMIDRERSMAQQAYDSYVGLYAPLWARTSGTGHSQVSLADAQFKQDFFAYSAVSNGLQYNSKDKTITPRADFVAFLKVITDDKLREKARELAGISDDYTEEEGYEEFDVQNPEVKAFLEKNRLDYSQLQAFATMSNDDFKSIIKFSKENPSILNTNCNFNEKTCSPMSAEDSKKVRNNADKLNDPVNKYMAEKYWGKGAFTFAQFRSGMAMAQGIHSLSATLLPNGVWKGWTDGVNKALGKGVFGWVFDAKSRITQNLCENKLDEPYSPQGIVMNVDQHGYKYSAAHVEVEGESIINYSVDPPVSTGFRRYLVTAGVTNSNENVPLEIAIFLEPGHRLVEEASVEAAEPYSLGKGAGVVIDDEASYERVCLVFSGDVNDYFDTVIDLKDNMLCNDVVNFDSSASVYSKKGGLVLV